MRVIFSILFLFVSFIGIGQTVQTIGAPGTRVVSRGDFISDSIFYLPRTLVTVRNPNVAGAVRYQPSDSTVYVYTGTQWILSGSRIDTNSISTRLWRQKGIDSVAALASAANFYTTNGTLTSNRTVTLSTFSLNFNDQITIDGHTIGRGALGGSTNVKYGANALDSNSSGTLNTALGENAGAGMVSGGAGTFIGHNAGRYTKGDNNTYIGRGVASLFAQTTAAARNTAIGEFALGRITTGDDNNAFGSNALTNLRSGNDNTVVGGYSLDGLTTGSRNTAIGTLAAGASNNGDNNVFIGWSAGYAFKGNSNVMIGYSAGYGFDSADNRLVIHNSSATDPLLHGDFSADTLRINGALSVRDVARNNTPARFVVFDSANGKLQTRDLVTFSKEFVTLAEVAYTALTTDHTILADATDGAFTITLPAASGLAGKIYTIKRINGGGNDVTIDANASETIDGDATKVLNSHWKYLQIQCDGSNWFIIANN
jgi:hypothetical protein